MNKKLLIFGGILTAAITIGCVGASASTITQNNYYSDNVFFPKGQYQMNFDFEIGAAASTSNDYNKVIYNNVLTRDIAEVNVQGTYFEEIYKWVNFQESQDLMEDIDLISYYSYVNPLISSLEKIIEYDIELTDSDLINHDLYFRISDFFYKRSDYQGHSLMWNNSSNYYTAWEEEDYDINDDIGFIDYTIFTLEDNIVTSQRIVDSIASTNLVSYSEGEPVFIDGFLIDYITSNRNIYAFYINDCVLKMKDLFYYEETINVEVEYYHYDHDMFERLGGLDFDISDDINISDFFINSVGGFMDFEIVPGFTFGLLLSFILTLSLIVWIIKVFMGG